MSHDGEDMQSLIFIQEHNVYVLWGQAGTQSINYKARSEKTLSDGTEAPGNAKVAPRQARLVCPPPIKRIAF